MNTTFNTSNQPTTLYDFSIEDTGDFIRKAQELFGQKYFQYADTLPVFEQVVLEAFVREYFSVTLVDGTVLRFSMDRTNPFRQPDYAEFAKFLDETDLVDLYDPHDVAMIEGKTQRGWNVTLKHESIHGWSIWLTRRYATYEISSVYQLPWRSAEYAPSDEIRTLVQQTEAAYQDIAPAAHKTQQIEELSQAIFNAATILLPLNDIVEQWPSVVNFNQPSVVVNVPDHYRMGHYFAPFSVTALSDCAVEIGNDGWSWTEFYRELSVASFEKIAKEIIAKDLDLALDAERERIERVKNETAKPIMADRPPRRDRSERTAS